MFMTTSLQDEGHFHQAQLYFAQSGNEQMVNRTLTLKPHHGKNCSRPERSNCDAPTSSSEKNDK